MNPCARLHIDEQIRGVIRNGPRRIHPHTRDFRTSTDSKMSEKKLAPTFVGLAIALFALPVFMAAYRAITGESHSNWRVLGRDFAIRRSRPTTVRSSPPRSGLSTWIPLGDKRCSKSGTPMILQIK
jgi:hypothetical protein